MPLRRAPLVFLSFLCAYSLFGATAAGNGMIGREAVLKLKPVGYWPADDGQGEVLRDLSSTGNPGAIHHVAWTNGLLNFRGAYQWLEVPSHKAYQSPAFSLGGWVFMRGKVYGGGWPNQDGMLFIGNADWSQRLGVQIFVRRDELVDVVQSGASDIGPRTHADLGKVVGRIVVPLGEWQQLLYTYDGSVGRLYVNGRLRQERKNLPYASVARTIRIGNDAGWWHMSVKSGALDGSVRELVWFDRALSEAEVETLCRVTKPLILPPALDQVVRAMEPTPADVPALLRCLQEGVSANFVGRASPTRRGRGACGTGLGDEADTGSPAFVPEGLRRGEACPTTRLLGICQNSEIGSVLGTSGQDQVRAHAALALGAHGARASNAVPVLVSMIGSETNCVLRVEDLLRNAVLRALLDIDPTNTHARAALPKLAKGQERFFSERGAGQRDYTATAQYNGATYRVGEGIGWKGVEPITSNDFRKVVEKVASDYPAAKTWRPASTPTLCRVPITKIGPDGREQKVYLEGENFVIDGTDQKVRSWSLFVDKAGYIHLMGGQHNVPDPNAYIPGSWERIGLSRSLKDKAFPQQLYWVSTKPESIESFEFVGRQDGPRAIPASYLNYMVFARDNHDEVYLYGRTDGDGWQSWGLYRYEVEARRWRTIGGYACDVIASARRHDPSWIGYLHDNIRDDLPTTRGNKILVWAWQPAFYNFCRDDWGLKFDPSNRMHVLVNVFGLDEAGYAGPSDVYAYSDDGGLSFRRADGTPLLLPLTINPAPEHNADVRKNDNGLWFRVWISLLRDAGYQGIPVNRTGTPLQSDDWNKKGK